MTIDYEKLPPQDLETEEAILSACLTEPCFGEASNILKADQFYKPVHQDVYAAMYRLFISHKPIDVLTVKEQMLEFGTFEKAGGLQYLFDLTHKVNSSANVETHCLIVKEKWVARTIITHSTTLIRDAYNPATDPFELLEQSTSGFDSIAREVQSSEQKDFLSTLYGHVERIKLAAATPDDQKYILGLRTGLYTLDRKILGLNSPDLIVLAGRPGEGKTTSAVQMADAILATDEPVGFVSAEMPLEQLMLKMLSINTDIDVHRLRNGALRSEEWDKFHLAVRKLEKYKFQVYDKPCTPEKAKALAKTWKNKHGIKAFFFDYIQRAQIPQYLMRVPRNDQITVITNSLKDIALENEIPVVALSQMTRDIEKRSGEAKRPVLSDLRDGGSIEQDADIIIFVFRPEEHGIKIVNGMSSSGITEFIIAKHRLGTKGAVLARFIGYGNRFDDSGFSKSQESYDNPAQPNLFPSEDTPF